jgi:predicted DNA-binding transcriptional regulator YafY
MKDNMRRLLIDRLLTEKKVVSFEELQNVLQASSPTIKRDLRYMRNVLKAPIVYSRSRGGYLYEDKPRSGEQQKRLFAVQHKQWYSPEELYVLVKTIDLLEELSKDKSSAISGELAPLRSRVTALLNLGGIPPKELLARVKVVDHSPLHTEPDTFETVGAALSAHKRLKIEYYSRSRRMDSIRDISPIRLVHYRSRWYVDAYCHVSEGLRTFAIENIRRAEVLPRAVKRIPLRETEAELDQSYGIFHGGPLKTAVLCFDETAAAYVRRQVWHPKQRTVAAGNGVRIYVPYAQSTELVGEILRWGPHVVVEDPPELRREVRDSLQETLSRYGS